METPESERDPTVPRDPEDFGKLLKKFGEEITQDNMRKKNMENFMRICDGVDYHAKLNIDMEKGEIYMFVIRRSGKGDLERKEAIRKVLSIHLYNINNCGR